MINPRTRGVMRGVATFEEEKGGLRIVVDLVGAADGLHGVHIHEFADCSAWDARTCGGHFNPDKKAHGAPGAPDSHAGDLGNVVVRRGTGRLEWVSPILTVRSGPYSVVGRSIVIHEYEDDYTTQPSGNAGVRLGCGEIELQE